MRNRYLDLLRAVAIVRVVVYHVTGLSVLTVLIPAMPVMFALAGSLMAASVDRSRLGAVGKRLRRLLPSLWVFAAVFVPAMLLTGLAWEPEVLLWLLPLQDPPANGWGAQALSANWYLRDFLWFVLLSPAALWLFRRAPWPTLAAPYAILLACEFAGWAPHVVVRDIGLYFGAWMLGFAHHDGLLRRLAPRRLLALAGTLAAAGLAWTLTHPGPRGYDLNDIPVGNALWSGAFILVALGFADRAEARLRLSARWERVVTVLNARALTIYLWHVPIIVGVTLFALDRGWPVLGAAGSGWRLAVVAVALVAVVALVGWVEDVAGRRRPVLLPGGRRVAADPAASSVPVSPAPIPVSPAPGNPVPVDPDTLPMPPDPFPDDPVPIPISPVPIPVSPAPGAPDPFPDDPAPVPVSPAPGAPDPWREPEPEPSIEPEPAAPAPDGPEPVPAGPVPGSPVPARAAVHAHAGTGEHLVHAAAEHDPALPAVPALALPVLIDLAAHRKPADGRPGRRADPARAGRRPARRRTSS